MTRLQITCPHEECTLNTDGSQTCLYCELRFTPEPDDDEETAFADGRLGYAVKVTP